MIETGQVLNKYGVIYNNPGHFMPSSLLFEPRREKTGLRGFRPGPTQTGLYSLRSRLEA